MTRNISCSFISFLHKKGIFCYFGSFLVNSGHFQLNSIISTKFLQVELVVIKHGCNVPSLMLILATLGGMFFLVLVLPKGLCYASNTIIGF